MKFFSKHKYNVYNCFIWECFVSRHDVIWYDNESVCGNWADNDWCKTIHSIQITRVSTPKKSSQFICIKQWIRLLCSVVELSLLWTATRNSNQISWHYTLPPFSNAFAQFFKPIFHSQARIWRLIKLEYEERKNQQTKRTFSYHE